MRRSRLLLPLAIVLVLLVSVAAGVVVLRARQPLLTLQVAYRTPQGPGLKQRRRWLESGPVRFVGFDRLLVAEPFAENGQIEFHGQIWGVASGRLERTLPEFPHAFDPAGARALVAHTDRPAELRLEEPHSLPTPGRRKS